MARGGEALGCEPGPGDAIGRASNPAPETTKLAGRFHHVLSRFRYPRASTVFSASHFHRAAHRAVDPGPPVEAVPSHHHQPAERDAAFKPALLAILASCPTTFAIDSLSLVAGCPASFTHPRSNRPPTGSSYQRVLRSVGRGRRCGWRHRGHRYRCDGPTSNASRCIRDVSAGEHRAVLACPFCVGLSGHHPS